MQQGLDEPPSSLPKRVNSEKRDRRERKWSKSQKNELIYHSTGINGSMNGSMYRYTDFNLACRSYMLSKALIANKKSTRIRIINDCMIRACDPWKIVREGLKGRCHKIIGKAKLLSCLFLIRIVFLSLLGRLWKFFSLIHLFWSIWCCWDQTLFSGSFMAAHMLTPS